MYQQICVVPSWAGDSGNEWLPSAKPKPEPSSGWVIKSYFTFLLSFTTPQNSWCGYVSLRPNPRGNGVLWKHKSFLYFQLCVYKEKMFRSSWQAFSKSVSTMKRSLKVIFVFSCEQLKHNLLNIKVSWTTSCLTCNRLLTDYRLEFGLETPVHQIQLNFMYDDQTRLVNNKTKNTFIILTSTILLLTCHQY